MYFVVFSFRNLLNYSSLQLELAVKSWNTHTTLIGESPIICTYAMFQYYTLISRRYIHSVWLILGHVR